MRYVNISIFFFFFFSFFQLLLELLEILDLTNAFILKRTQFKLMYIKKNVHILNCIVLNANTRKNISSILQYLSMILRKYIYFIFKLCIYTLIHLLE